MVDGVTSFSSKLIFISCRYLASKVESLSFQWRWRRGSSDDVKTLGASSLYFNYNYYYHHHRRRRRHHHHQRCGAFIWMRACFDREWVNFSFFLVISSPEGVWGAFLFYYCSTYRLPFKLMLTLSLCSSSRWLCRWTDAFVIGGIILKVVHFSLVFVFFCFRWINSVRCAASQPLAFISERLPVKDARYDDEPFDFS